MASANGSERAGTVALVTGAGSGIGRATAVSLARSGCHVVLTDVTSSGLVAVHDTIATELHCDSTVRTLDVSDPSNVQEVVREIGSSVGCRQSSSTLPG